MRDVCSAGSSHSPRLLLLLLLLLLLWDVGGVNTFYQLPFPQMALTQCYAAAITAWSDCAFQRLAIVYCNDLVSGSCLGGV
jgi:hypothetical protein